MAAEDDTGSIAHASGLGVMPSMSSECTPLKHKYDACFNKWFEGYLGLPAASSSSSSLSPSTKEEGQRDSGVAGLFSRKSKSTLITSSSSSDDSNGRKRLRERLDGDCGPFWKEYQTCVLRAVKSKDLEGLIEEARISNPFPFPQDRKQDTRPNNEPFPFPAAKSKDDDIR